MRSQAAKIADTVERPERVIASTATKPTNYGIEMNDGNVQTYRNEPRVLQDQRDQAEREGNVGWWATLTARFNHG